MPTATRSRSQWIALLAGPTLSLVAFVVAYFINPLSFGSRTPLAAVPAALLAIVVLSVSHNLAAFREIERASAFSDRIYEAVKDYLHVTKVGVPEVAFKYVLGRLAILQEVKNTTLNLPEELERANESFYETAAYRDVAGRVAEATAKGLRWKDIGDASATTRLRAMQGAAQCAVGKRAAGKRTTGYRYRLLGHREPQINFMILSYHDGSSEVLFNWDFRNIGQDPVVLLSRDHDIIEMFAVQYEHLWRASSPDHDSTATRSTSVK